MYHSKYFFALLLLILSMSFSSSVCAVSNKDDTKASMKSPRNITIAIMDFKSETPGNPEFGHQLGDILTARMSIYDQFELVEREKLQEILKEHELNIAGVTDANEALRIGKLVGARILIFGRAFTVEDEVHIVAKIVGTETSQVKAIMAKGKIESKLSETIDQLADKLVEGLNKWAQQLLPADELPETKAASLKKRLTGKKLPAVNIMISESHIGQKTSDPAAETEIKKVFKEVGFTIIEDKAGKNADIIITGEGISEAGGKIGGLFSGVARLEVQAVRKDNQKIIASESTTKRILDLTENIAGKTALQYAGHQLAITIIEKIAVEAGY